MFGLHEYFIPGLRAAGVVNTGAEPTHPEGSKDNAKIKAIIPHPLLRQYRSVDR
jgi:hypothetical protein